MSEDLFNETMKTFLEKLGITRIYGIAETKEGATLIMDHGITMTERAGMMYQLKKLVDVEISGSAIAHVKRMRDLEKHTEETRKNEQEVNKP